MKLKILHTNDIHSNFENFSKIVSKINELKDETTIILDAGDFADFKRLELQGTDGMAALELLQCGGYDAIAVGNNETFNGLDTLKNMVKNSKLPFLSSNAYSIGFKEIHGVKKSFILNKNNLRILIIGASPDLGVINDLRGLVLKDYIEVVKEEIRVNSGKYDLCIVLSHLGMDKDKELAMNVQGIDVVIGGHFHILMEEPEIVNGKIIFTSGSFGENLGVLELEVNDKKVELIKGENINIQQCNPCERIIDILKENKKKAIDKLSVPLYNLESDLWHDVVEENPMTNLLADALRDLLKCDIGLINSGVINGGMRKGEVSQKKLLELSPSPLNPTSFDIQGKYLRRLHVSNVVIQHNGRKIVNIFINEEKLQEEKWYSIATSDYLQRGTGYASLKNNENVSYNKEYLRDTLKEYLAKREFVEKAFMDRWILTPGAGLK